MSASRGRRGRAAWPATLMVAGLVLPSSARAGFTVFPASVSASQARASARTGTIDVRLHGELGVRYQAVVQDAVQQPSGAFTFRAPSGSLFSASSWLEVTPGRFAGSPDRVQPIDYSIRVPATAEPGDHLAAVTIERLPPAGSGQVSTVEAIAVRFVIRVPGALREGVGVGPVSVPSVSGGGPVDASVTIRNAGNVRLDLAGANAGRLGIYGGGSRRALLKLSGTLFPGAQRTFTLAWQDPPLLGHFNARASVRTPAGTITRSAALWMVPWRQAGALVLIALAAVVLAGGRLRRRHQASVAPESS